MDARSRTESRFKELIAAPTVALHDIQQASFGGVPDYYRAWAWKLLLGYLPLVKSQRAQKLEDCRKQYSEFLEVIVNSRRKSTSSLQAALNEAADGSESPRSPSAVEHGTTMPLVEEDDDFLWNEIEKDVSRTNPDLDWFVREEHTAPMKRILFVYARLNSGVRYVQGMNEILAPLWFIMATEREEVCDAAQAQAHPQAQAQVPYTTEAVVAVQGPNAATHSPLPSTHRPAGGGPGSMPRPGRERSFLVVTPSEAAATPSRHPPTHAHAQPSDSDAAHPAVPPSAARRWQDTPLSEAEADCFFCFMTLMSECRDLFMQAHDDSEGGVRGWLGRFARMLARREPAIAAHLRAIGLDVQFFALRWCMTLLSREFSFPEVVMVWDSLLADPSRSTGGFPFLMHLAVAMVRLQKEALLRADFGTALKLLQRYPPTDFLHLLASGMEVRAEENAEAAHAAHAGGGTSGGILSSISAGRVGRSGAGTPVAPSPSPQGTSGSTSASSSSSSFAFALPPSLSLLRPASWAAGVGTGSGTPSAAASTPSATATATASGGGWASWATPSAWSLSTGGGRSTPTPSTGGPALVQHPLVLQAGPGGGGGGGLSREGSMTGVQLKDLTLARGARAAMASGITTGAGAGLG